MFKKLKSIIYTKHFIALTYLFVKIYSMTFKLKVLNEQQWLTLVKEGKTVLLCCWHQQFFGAIGYFTNYSHLNPAIMISQSRDGELIAGVAKRVGWDIKRGSSSKGGKEAMAEMIDHLKCYRFGAHILDGPRGPIGKVKSGVIKMAKESSAIIVPFYTSANRGWFFNSWDRFMVPKPFARLTLLFGEPIRFEIPNTNEEFEEHRLHLENTMKLRLF
ncbi:MAG: lysophospholipid acyltransferase family protein [Desulfamplus sp.]|nr:lysophospholipid acyltransferase family protein [Desulfamplus sp.]